MPKFEYLTVSSNGQRSSATTSDWVARGLLNRTISLVSVAEDGSGFRINLTDGSSVKFHLKTNGADVIYYGPGKD